MIEDQKIRTSSDAHEGGDVLLRAKRIYLNNDLPSILYRYFDLECYADAFASGNIWITTLDSCRRHEGEYRGDPNEGTLTYNTGFIRGDGDNPAYQEVAGRIGMKVAPGARNVTLSNNSLFQRLPDAWMLCCTERHVPDGLKGIGPYCVKIQRTREYFEKLTATFSSYELIREATIGRVVYADRSYRSLEAEPGPIGFVKPPDIYSEQSEVRMLWMPASHQTIVPRLVECTSLQRLCTRIS